MLLSSLLAVAVASAALARDFPSRAVRVVTPFPGGSGPDTVLRMVGEKVSRAWGQQVIVENRPGANGAIAIEAVKKAAPDGHTLVQMDDTHMALHPHLYRKLSYDPVRDFHPAATLSRTYFFVVVASNSSWRSVADLVAAARARKGEVTYGSWFVGSPGHVGGALMELATGTSMVHVPFKEMSQLYAAVGNGDVAWAFGSAGSAGPMYRAGKVRFIAVAAPRRLPGFADVPTVAEAGGPAGIDVKAWLALLAPHGTPKAAIERINDAVGKALEDKEIRERYASFAFEPYSLSPAEIARQIETDSRRYAEVVKRARIALD